MVCKDIILIFINDIFLTYVDSLNQCVWCMMFEKYFCFLSNAIKIVYMSEFWPVIRSI